MIFDVILHFLIIFFTYFPFHLPVIVSINNKNQVNFVVIKLNVVVKFTKFSTTENFCFVNAVKYFVSSKLFTFSLDILRSWFGYLCLLRFFIIIRHISLLALRSFKILVKQMVLRLFFWKNIHFDYKNVTGQKNK